MALLTSAPNKTTGNHALFPSFAVGGYLALSSVVGLIAGTGAILRQVDVLPPALAERIATFHPYAMLLFVGVPAFLGVFGRLFLPRDLKVADVAGLARIDGMALGFMLASLIAFLVCGSVATGLGLWSAGAVLLSLATLLSIFNARSGAGVVPPRGQDRAETATPFSVFVWTQLCAATGILIVAPVLAAGVTRELLGWSGDMPSFEKPLTLIVLVAAFGLAVRIFDAATVLGRKARIVAIAVTAFAADGGAVFWARSAFIHAAPADTALMGTGLAVVASAAFAGLWLQTLWRVKARISVPVLWVSGFFVLLAAGWAGSGVHTAVLNGAVFVLFGGFYCWVNDVTGGRYAQNLARAQFVLMFSGVLLSAAGASPVLQAAGGAVMVASLLVLASVLVSMMRRVGDETFAGPQEIRR
ncbi:heme-copper oxidase family protein [Acetobacter conturbans]|uniref:Cytochrome oxidase subunit I profile domain-containing protein n=1 Tax=Acetobacter conturbans TaxID=1737472 RepID=A0ABX0JWZ2_9PROT|nr:hypothetical protein [Acetobacter conturbans]NHN87788.1 hypothetical protein [Acetobacter conturbans]